MPTGSIIIRTECQCGHRATLTAETLKEHGYDPETFMDWHKLRCDRCKRRGRPLSVQRAWTAGETQAPYSGTFSAGPSPPGKSR